NAVAEAGREALHLPLDRLGHVYRRAVRHVTVGITGVATRGRAARVDLALLADDEEGPLAVSASVHVALGGTDLGERAADVDGRRFAAGGVAPRNRTVERPVQFEGTGSVTIAQEASPVAGGKSIAGDVLELIGRRVEQDDARRRKLGEARD